MKVNTSQSDAQPWMWITSVVMPLSHSSPRSLLPSPCSPPAKLSPPVFQTLNSLSITNCAAPPHPSPPLFLFVRHWSFGVQTSAEKHSLSLFRRDERGAHRGNEKRRGGMAAETDRQAGREMVVPRETEWEASPMYLDKPLPAQCARVCGPAWGTL